MEQTISLRNFRTSSSPNNTSTVTRKIWRTRTSSPTSQTSSSFAIGDPIYYKSLGSVKQLHARTLKTTDLWNSASAMDSLVQIYSDLGDFRSAAMVFFVALQYGALSWRDLANTLGSRHGSTSYLLEVFRELHVMGAAFSVGVLSRALENCAEVADSWLGFQIHAYLSKAGLEDETYIRCCLMDFYARCCSLESTNELFASSRIQDSILWNKFIMINVEGGRWSVALELFSKMQFWGLGDDDVTLSKVLHACGKAEAVKEGKAIHGHAIRSGRFLNPLVSNSLISMYSKNSLVSLARRVFEYIGGRTLVSWNSIISCCSLNGFLEDALELFYEMVAFGVKPDLVTWNCLISGCSHHGSPHRTFEFFRRMQSEGLKPNSSTITSVLRSVTASGLITFGREIHGYAIRHGNDCNVFVGTALTDMYVKCCNLTHARRLFDKTPRRNVLTWNSIVSGYAQGGMFDEALELLKQMEEEGELPDLTTWNSLISGYSIHGLSNQAAELIHQMKANGVEPNVVSWTALISGCCRNEQYDDALHYFIEMQDEGIRPNSVTTATLLRACAAQALLQKGREVHCFATRKALNGDVYVATALIDMYSKSGSLAKAHRVFERLENKNLASWNAMIMGLGAHGQGKEAMSFFNQMCEARTRPDGITFTALLSGCRHSGLVDEGWTYFDSMSKYNVTATLEHYTCMVDLLARSGYLDEAWDFIQGMPLEPDASIWGSLLSACRLHNNVELAEMAAKRLFPLEPYNSANYLLMMSIYARANRWADAEGVRDAMSAAGVTSRAGWSWIEIDQTVHVFEIDGRPHPEIGEIYFELYQVVAEMRRVGYVPDTSCIVRNVGEEEKEKLLLSHTEKLAITYGLIRTASGTPIRVIKNTRVCNDCHEVAKYMSQISGREILLRDGVRFHHFKGGRCTCNDFW